MAELVFDWLGARAERFSVVPALTLCLRISETTGQPVDAIALRCQIRIEPHRRRYGKAEARRLHDLFGDPSRWADTLKPLQFTTVPVMVPGFSGSTELDLPVPFTYDLQISATRYFASLDDGEVPLLLLFSGTVISKGETGFAVQQVPWHKETQVRLPVAVWRELMDLYFPGSGWLRLRTDTVDALARVKSREVLPTWDESVERLLTKAGEGP